MTNTEGNLVILSSCMFSRSSGGTTMQNPSYVWSEEDNSAEVWDNSPGQQIPDSKTKNRQLKSKTSPPYKHVPHREKPPQIVARRNARERRRVQAVNVAFSRLRKVVPIDNNRGKRVSKVKTLHKAIEYIAQLQDMLHQAGQSKDMMPGNPDLNKENSGGASNRWDVYDLPCRPAGGPADIVQFLEDFQDDF